MDIKPEDIVIAVMGITGSGKSTFISYFAEDVIIGHGLEACTSSVNIYECAYDSKTKLFFVDTPSFDDTYKDDPDILHEIANWLAVAYANNIKLTGIIYLHRIQDVRMGGAAMKNLHMFKKLCGDGALASVVLATTWWDGVTVAIGEERERELATGEAFWAGMIKKGSRLFRQDNGIQSARQIIDNLVNRRQPVILKIQEELVTEGKTLGQTEAGRVIQGTEFADRGQVSLVVRLPPAPVPTGDNNQEPQRHLELIEQQSLHALLGLRILSLDGGGIKGLFGTIVLEAIMEKVRQIDFPDSVDPLKPCDYFNFIGGTSTGG